MTEMDAAQLRVTIKQIFQIAAFLIVLGLSISGGVAAAVAWKAGIENRLDNIQQHQNEEDQKLMWIMENMQRRKGAENNAYPFHANPSSLFSSPDLSMWDNSKQQSNLASTFIIK